MHQAKPQVQPLLTAALLLAGREPARALGLASPAAADILAATGAGRSQAYVLADRLLQLLPSLHQRPGRPPVSQGTPPQELEAAYDVAREVIGYLKSAPGSARAGETRDYYSESFRAFILQLYHRYAAKLSVEAFASACRIPHTTFKTWLASPRRATETNPPKAETVGEDQATAPPTNATAARIATVVAEWQRWRGSFCAFVHYLQRELNVPMGRDLINSILQTHCGRRPKRRPRRSPDEVALRGAFETFFPNAQWVGDGKTVVVTIDDAPIAINLELNVDASSGAWVGLSVSNEEDSQAVIDAFNQGVQTTGTAPLAELLDNKAANHTEQVEGELADAGTLIIRATLGRAQNKAHVEGAFGLFSQAIPELRLDTTKGPRDTAKQLLQLIATVMARVINRRPRRDRAGQSRFDLHQRTPTPQEHAAAKAALEERARQQEQRRQTQEQRQSPEVKAFLDEQFATLGIQDPKRYHRLALGRYPIEVLCDAIAIFKSKMDSKTIPEGCDPPRYLLGIAKNICLLREMEALTHHLYVLRCRAKDHVIAALQQKLSTLEARAEKQSDTVVAIARMALDSDRAIERYFWVHAACALIRKAGQHARQLYLRAAAVVRTAFKVAPTIRQSILLSLADSLVSFA